MHKRLKSYLLCFSILYLCQGFAQANNKQIQLETYFGVPNAGSTMFHMVQLQQHWGNLTGTGPFGLRAFRTIHAKWSLGLDICYSETNLNFNERFTGGQMVNYHFTKLGFMFSTKYHLLENMKFDFYSIYGIGGGIGKIKIDNQTNPKNLPSTSYSPICFRLALGLDYQINKIFGINATVGLGQGGLVNLAITTQI